MTKNELMNPSEVHHLLCDIWRLYLRCVQSPMDDAAFKLFIDECGKTQEKYETIFSKKLLLELIGEIDRVERFRRQN